MVVWEGCPVGKESITSNPQSDDDLIARESELEQDVREEKCMPGQI